MKKKSISALKQAMRQRFKEEDPDQKLLSAAMGKNLQHMQEALQQGANMDAMRSDDIYEGKTAMHLCAMRGFVEGMVLLRAYGADIDMRDGKNGNTALHLLPNQGDIATFRTLLEMGARIDIENNYGHSVAGMLNYNESNRESPFVQAVEHRRMLPRRADFKGLTLEEAFRPNQDGYCLMDNPQTLRRIDEAMAALTESGTPLSFEHLQQSAKDGKPFIEKVMACNGLDAVIAAINTQGEQVHGELLVDADGQPSAFAQEAVRWRQVPALFTVANWQGAGAGAMGRALHSLPEEGQKQVTNEFQLREALKAGTEQGMGR